MKIFQILAQLREASNCPEGASGAENANCLTTLPQVSAGTSTLTVALQVVFGTLSAIAVLVIMIQAAKFTLSNGDPDKAASARKGIIYALVGLAISLSANVIVTFVLRGVF